VRIAEYLDHVGEHVLQVDDGVRGVHRFGP
jgi:hypothetical protein